jgi:hypothetical protein
VSKAKTINFELIEEPSQPYKVLDAMRRFHRDITGARIALAWRLNLAPDKDGHLILGKCVKASDLQRELVDYDFVILLNRKVWEDPDFSDEKRRALMDHELCHAAPSTDKDGAHREDERGRKIYRVRKHDIEEFYAIVARHGCYKRDLEVFADTLMKRRNAPLLEPALVGDERAIQ